MRRCSQPSTKSALRRAVSIALAPCAVGLTILASGCTSGDDTIDLAAIFETADAYVETENIDFGTAPARRHLLDGWSPGDERWAGREDETFVWGVGNQATLRFFQIESQDLVLRLRGRPHAPGGDQRLEAIRIGLNGVTLPAELSIEPGWQDYSLAIPSRFMRVGGNRITFAFDTFPSPRPSRGREFRFAFDRARFANATVTALPRTELPGGPPALILPYLAGVDFELDLSPGAEVLLQSVQAYGRPLGDAGRLHLRYDVGSQTITHDIDVSNSPVRVALQLEAPAAVRLSVIALPPRAFYDLEGHAAQQDTGLRLLRPRVSPGRR